MSDESTNLAPPLTDYQLKKNDELQQSLRRQLSLRPTTAEDFARVAVADGLKLLNLLSDKAPAKIRQTKQDICQWLVKLGEFKEATRLAPDDTAKFLYLAYQKAEKTADGEWCGHSQWKDAVPNYFIEFEYFNERQGRKLAMVKCNECDFRNAQNTPDDLRKLKELRTKLRAGISENPQENTLKPIDIIEALQ